ncbi:NADH-quinone oxidoreductase subunit NuoK [Candidatus Sumerlaeota bacterium]|nr:NADH-quinone oxidoreductase subunit NuoK [Candidatus Sumerlaeota bacterium]
MTSLLQPNLILATLLFTIGILGVMWKRNAIALFMSVELMLNAANLAFVSFAHELGIMSGGILVLFVMTVAAAEAGVGLAIFIALFRARRHIRVDEHDTLHG